MRLQYSRTTLAYSVLRRLYNIYDAGGHSMRSMKSYLVENILAGAPERTPPAGSIRSAFKGLKKKVRNDRRRRGVGQLSFFFSIEHISDKEYACVALLALLELQRQDEECSCVEQELIVTAAFLFGLSEDRAWYRRLLDSTGDLEELVLEGRRRQHVKFMRDWERSLYH